MPAAFGHVWVHSAEGDDVLEAFELSDDERPVGYEGVWVSIAYEEWGIEWS